MNRLTTYGALAFALNLMGCATVLEGGSETIALNVMPENAQCLGWRDGKMVGRYDPTSQSMTVAKSKDDLVILCRAFGHEEKRVRLVAGRSDWDVPGINAFDYVTGALYKYNGALVIVLDEDG